MKDSGIFEFIAGWVIGSIFAYLFCFLLIGDLVYDKTFNEEKSFARGNGKIYKITLDSTATINNILKK